jgi:hypothetical protein
MKDELGALKAKISKLESEKVSLHEDNQRLEQNVGFWEIELTLEAFRRLYIDAQF